MKEPTRSAHESFAKKKSEEWLHIIRREKSFKTKETRLTTHLTENEGLVSGWAEAAWAGRVVLVRLLLQNVVKLDWYFQQNWKLDPEWNIFSWSPTLIFARAEFLAISSRPLRDIFVCEFSPQEPEVKTHLYRPDMDRGQGNATGSYHLHKVLLVSWAFGWTIRKRLGS